MDGESVYSLGKFTIHSSCAKDLCLFTLADGLTKLGYKLSDYEDTGEIKRCSVCGEELADCEEHFSDAKEVIHYQCAVNHCLYTLENFVDAYQMKPTKLVLASDDVGVIGFDDAPWIKTKDVSPKEVVRAMCMKDTPKKKVGEINVARIAESL